MSASTRTKGSATIMIGVAVVLAVIVFLGLSDQSTSAATALVEAKARETKAVAIALADPDVQSLIAGKHYRVVEVSKSDSSDFNIGIYVYSDARSIGIGVDLSSGKVADIRVADNSRGTMPTREEGRAAYEIAISDQRFLELAGGEEFGYHGHQIVKLDPSDPCYTHRCVSISMDLKHDPSHHDDHTHHAIIFIDLTTNSVTGLLLQPGTFNVDVPGNEFVQLMIDDFRGRAVSLDEVQKATRIFLQDQEIVNAIQDKHHSLRLISDSPNTVTVSSDVVVLGAEFPAYATATVNLATSSIMNKTVSSLNIDELKSSYEALFEDPSIKEAIGNMGMRSIVIEPVIDNDRELRFKIHPLHGSSVEAVLDSASRAVKEVKTE